MSEEKKESSSLPKFPGLIPTPKSPSQPMTPAAEVSPESPILLPVGPGAPDAANSVNQETEELPPAPWLGAFDLMLIVLLLVLGFFLSSFQATNSDLWMHLAAGKRISEGQFKFGEDPFLWTTEATDSRGPVYWTHHSWLFSWLNYALHQNAPESSLVILKALAVVALLVFLTGIIPVGGSRWAAFFCVTLALLALSPRLLLHPIIFSFLLLGLELFILFRAGVLGGLSPTQKPNPAWLWGIPVLMILWVNFDAWFVLGILVLVLALLSTFLVRFLNLAPEIPTGTLALATLVGVVATVANPHGLNAWTLPPDLSVILYRFTPGTMELPDSLVGGGRVLSELQPSGAQSRDAYLATSMSPFLPEYLTSPNLGWNITGMAFFFLLFLSLGSFLLTIFMQGSWENSKLHGVRFFVWLLFALLATASHRMIPFFVIVAAPMTALNLLALRPLEPETGRLPRILRIVSLPLMLVLIALAWPGWVSGPMTSESPRRVTWDVYPDPSLKSAAESLRKEHAAGNVGNVFTASFDIAHYCAWFAPGVKCAMDSRVALLVPEIETYTAARAYLFGDIAPKKAEKAIDYLLKREVTHVVLGAPNQPAISHRGLMKFWTSEREWRMLPSDSRVAVFAWSRKKASPSTRWDPAATLDTFHREAFGEIPKGDRLPDEGPTLTKEPRSFFADYWVGVPNSPSSIFKIGMLANYYRLHAEPDRWAQPFGAGREVLAGASITTMTHMLPGASFPAAVYQIPFNWLISEQKFRPSGMPLVRTMDFGPPSLPVLMVRTARQGLQEAPRDPRAFLAVAEAYNHLGKIQEEYWTNTVGRNVRNMRTNLRNLQIVSAFYEASLLRPDEPSIHYQLANVYQMLHLFDLEVEHLFRGMELDELRPIEDANLKKIADQRRKYIAARKAEVDKRMRSFNSAAAKSKGVMKYFEAMRLPYSFVDSSNNQAFTDPDGRGLAKLGLEILDKLAVETKDEVESREVLLQYIDLMLKIGRVAEVAEEMPRFRKILGPMAVSYDILVAGCLGNYAQMQKGFEQIEDSLGNVDKELSKALPAKIAMTILSSNQPGVSSVLAQQELTQLVQSWNGTREETAELQAFRGITALEQGDTAAARRYFEVAQASAGTLYYNDRPIVERYLTFLTRYGANPANR